SEDDRRRGVLGQELVQASVAGRPDERLRQALRFEALAGRARVRRLVRDDLGAEGNEPLEPLVEAVEDRPLQRLVALWTFAPEVLERVVAPDDAAREEHRASGPVTLLEHDGIGPKLSRACRGA